MLLIFMLLSIGEAKSWNKYIYDILNSTIAPQQTGLMIWNGSIWVEAATEASDNNNLAVSLVKDGNAVNVTTMATDSVGPGTFSLAVRAFAYGWNSIDNEFVRLRADRIIDTLKTISTIHSEVHDGHMYNASYIWETLADDATGVFLIDTSTKNAHAVINVATGGNAQVKIYEDAVMISSGTGLSEINMNRVSGRTPMANIYHSPESVLPTTLIFQTFVGGGAGVGAATTASGGTTRIDTEWIFKKNELYVVSVENESGGAAFTSIVVEWYEEEID